MVDPAIPYRETSTYILALWGASRLYHSAIHAMYEMRPLLLAASTTSMQARKAHAILERELERHTRDMERAG